VLRKEDLIEYTKSFYKLNFINYLFGKFASIVIPYTVIIMLYQIINGSFNIRYLLILVFLIYSIKLYLHFTVLKVNSTIYSKFMEYLKNNPIVVLTNPNPNYNEMQRVIFYNARVSIQKNLRNTDFKYWLPIEQLTNPILTRIIDPTILYRYFYRYFHIENHYNFFCEEFSKKKIRKMLKKTFENSLFNYSRNNSGHSSKSA